MKIATMTNLNSIVEFDIPFEVHDGNVISDSKLHSPTVMWTDDGDSDVDIDGRDDWEAVDGFSGQYSYSGPVMHPSEFLGGGMARYVLDNPGTYVITEVIDPTPEDDINYTEDPIGWILLKLKEQ